MLVPARAKIECRHQSHVLSALAHVLQQNTEEATRLHFSDYLTKAGKTLSSALCFNQHTLTIPDVKLARLLAAIPGRASGQNLITRCHHLYKIRTARTEPTQRGARRRATEENCGHMCCLYLNQRRLIDLLSLALNSVRRDSLTSHDIRIRYC